MGGYFDEEPVDEEWDDLEEGATSGDPFEGLNKRDQDIFFRVLDVIPDEDRETAIEYFMENPRKIRAVVDNVKQKQELIKNKDIEGLNRLFEEERVVIQKMDQTPPEIPVEVEENE